MDNDRRIFLSLGSEVSPAQLADLLGNLRYDALAEYLAAITNKLFADAAASRCRSLWQRATRLEDAAAGIERARASISAVWVLCRRKMELNNV